MQLIRPNHTRGHVVARLGRRLRAHGLWALAVLALLAPGCASPVRLSQVGGGLRAVDFAVDLTIRIVDDRTHIVDAEVRGSAGAAPVEFDGDEHLSINGISMTRDRSIGGGSVFRVRVTSSEPEVILRFVGSRDDGSLRIRCPRVQIEHAQIDGASVRARYGPSGDGAIQASAVVVQQRGEAAVRSTRSGVEDTGEVEINLLRAIGSNGAAPVFGPGEATLMVSRTRCFRAYPKGLPSRVDVTARCSDSLDLEIGLLPGWPPPLRNPEPRSVAHAR